MNDLLYLDFRGNLGLGDELVLNGLVRCLLKKGERLAIPCRPGFKDAVSAMYRDVPPEQLSIDVINGPERKLEGIRSLALGARGKQHRNVQWDNIYYVQAGVPFAEKWASFKVASAPPPSEISTPGVPPPHRVFIHDDARRKFIIPMQEGYRPSDALPFWSHYHVLRGADQIHCMDSCFANLADLSGVEGELFFHQYAKPTRPPIFARRWRFIEDREEVNSLPQTNSDGPGSSDVAPAPKDPGHP